MKYITKMLLLATLLFVQTNGEIAKRELYGYDLGTNFNHGSLGSNFHQGPLDSSFHQGSLGAHYPNPASAVWVPKPQFLAAPSPAEIASAITAAKEASSNVIAAQQRVSLAKNDVLLQQKLASHKEAQAALALQQTEAAAAVQRQLASAAASAVIYAQQRLARAKSEVAEQQRIAAERETTAALAIQRSAIAAAAEIRKTEHTAAKVAAINNSHANAVLKHVTATKDASVAATSSAVNANLHVAAIGNGPWFIPQKVTHYGSW